MTAKNSGKKDPADVAAADVVGVEALRAQIAALEKERDEATAARDAAEAARKKAEEKTGDNADGAAQTVPGIVPGTQAGEYVEVFCKIPNGIEFTLAPGEKVVLNGKPLSALLDSQGRKIPGHGYGVTVVPVDVWDAILARWGKMPVFDSRSPKIFGRLRGSGGADQAEEQQEIRTGFEQIKVKGKNRDKTLRTKSTDD